MRSPKPLRLAVLILVIYSTTEGHTRRLAQFAAARLRGRGYEVRLHDAADRDPPDPAGFDAAFLLASVHLGRYHYSFVDFARNNHNALNVIPTAFVSVSLSAAGANPSDLAGIHACTDRLEHDTLWHPGAVYHAAGAMRFSAYGFFTTLAIKYIARQRGMNVKTSDAAFETFIDRFAADRSPLRDNQRTRRNERGIAQARILCGCRRPHRNRRLRHGADRAVRSKHGRSHQ